MLLKNHRLSLLLLLCLGMLWGSGYVLAKIATSQGVPALGYSFWQSIGPALFLSFIVICQKQTRTYRLEHIRFFFICGLIGIALPNTNMYFAAPHLPAGALALLVNTVPMITFTLAVSFGIEQFNWRAMLAIILGLSGLAIIILPAVHAPEQAQLPWFLATLLSPICFALCALFSAKYRPSHSDALSLAAGMLVASTLFLTPVVVSSDQFYLITWPLNLADKVILLEIVLSSIGYVIFFALINRAGPIYYSLVSCVVALAGIFWGWYIFDEAITPSLVCAFGFIIAAIAIATHWQRTNQVAS